MSAPGVSVPAPTPRRRSRRWLVALVLLALLAALALRPLTLGLDLVRAPGRFAVVTTGGAWASALYLARTERGVVVFDLGWLGAGGALADGLETLGAGPGGVAGVFLTHAHRDHVLGWPAIGRAPLHLGEAEIPLLLGERPPGGSFPALADRLDPHPSPRRGSLVLVPVARDTIFTFGADTVWAFPVPGHTPGSTAWLFRGVLFIGDVMNWRPMRGWTGARPEMSDDVAQSRTSLRALWARLGEGRVQVVCTSHAKCARMSAELRRLSER
jgi:hydroxyacylglutathione hydrolase